MTFIRKIQPTSAPDTALVSEYQHSRNLEVLAELYQQYMDLVYGVCLKYLADEETAKDAVMNIFEELIIKLQTHKIDNFKGWLHVVTKNHCLMQLRSPKHLKTTGLNENIMQLEETAHLNGMVEKEAELEQMTACIQSLPAEQQQCVDLFYLKKKSYNEIAEITGYDWKSVRSYIQNGRRNLKICMENARATIETQ